MLLRTVYLCDCVVEVRSLESHADGLLNQRVIDQVSETVHRRLVTLARARGRSRSSRSRRRRRSRAARALWHWSARASRRPAQRAGLVALVPRREAQQLIEQSARFNVAATRTIVISTSTLFAGRVGLRGRRRVHWRAGGELALGGVEVRAQSRGRVLVSGSRHRQPLGPAEQVEFVRLVTRVRRPVWTRETRRLGRVSPDRRVGGRTAALAECAHEQRGGRRVRRLGQLLAQLGWHEARQLQGGNAGGGRRLVRRGSARE